MAKTAISDLDAGGTLTVLEHAVATRRSAERAVLRHVAHWADLHGDHAGVTRAHGKTDGEGEPRREHPTYRRFGGEGTPVVAEFATAELGLSLQVHPLSARALIADTLDLRHRLTPLWEAMLNPATADLVEVWVLRKIAAKTRHLGAGAAAAIGADLAPLMPSLPPGRLLERADSLILLADAEQDEAERRDQLVRRFVWFNQSNQRGLKGLYAKLSAADAIVGDGQVQRLADLLLAQDFSSGVAAADLDPMDVARSRALGLLISDPAGALAMITASSDSADTTPARAGRARLVLHLHLSEDALQMLATSRGSGWTPQGVGRLEGEGPVSLSEALELLHLADVTIRPVLDPAASAPVDSYAFTGNLREAVLIRTPADVYPYASCTTHSMDIDHSTPFTTRQRAQTDPAQTRIDNAGPMTRHTHRIKTHGPMEMRQPLPGLYVWRSAHGRYRATDSTGTHLLDPVLGAGFFSEDPIDMALSRLSLQHRLGQLAS